MSVRNLQFLMKPRSVAVFGASDTPGSVGGLIIRNILDAGFAGDVYAVNPRHQVVAGRAAYDSLAALPQAPDLAVLAVPPDQVGPTIAALGARGTKAAVVITAGIESSEWKTAILQLARPHLLRLVGPNCFGVLTPAIGLNAYFGRSPVRPGHLALVAQSGAMIATLLDWAVPRGIGFSHVTSLGDMIDVDFGDMLDMLANDRDTHAILLYVESITHPRKFMSAARAAARLKPVIVLKAGQTAEGSKAAASHTGALAGNDAVYEAAFVRAGVLRVADLQSLFNAAAVLASGNAVRGDRLAIVTNGGGAGVIAADALVKTGGRLAELSSRAVEALSKALPATWSGGNPIDLIGDADGERYAAALDAIADDPNVDAVLVMHCPTGVCDPLAVAKAVSASSAVHQRPHLACWLGSASVEESRRYLSKQGLPVFDTPEAAINGFMAMIRYARLQHTLMEVPPPVADIPSTSLQTVRAIISKNVDSGAHWLEAASVRQVLGCYGIPTNRIVHARTPEAAVEAAQKIQGPVAVKISSPDVVHKSDIGGVVLGISDPDQVGAAAQLILARVAARVPNARITGVTVEEMVVKSSGQELFVGMTIDPTFGPIIAFGQGGTAVEVINDISLGLPPLNKNLALGMIGQTRVARQLDGYRGNPPANIGAVADVIVSLSQLVIDHPEITDIDLNPLVADSGGVVVVDARIRVQQQMRERQLVISPYPAHLAREVTLSAKRGVFIRPIRPQDEDALRTMVETLGPADRHFRFFAPLQEVGHSLAARVTQIDYDREMVLAAFDTEAAESQLLGVVHLHADPDNVTAEFAVLVRTDWQKRGLGTALIREVIGVARDRGIEKLWGDVLRDNGRMLALCQECGFQRTAAEDPMVVRVVLPLEQDKAA